MLESKGCSKVLATTESVSRIQDARIEKETKQTIKNKGINRKQASIIAKENTKVNSIPSYFEDISKISLNNSTVKLVSSKNTNPLKLISTNAHERLEEINKNLYRKIDQEHKISIFNTIHNNVREFTKEQPKNKPICNPINSSPDFQCRNIDTQHDDHDFEKRIMNLDLCKFSFK